MIRPESIELSEPEPDLMPPGGALEGRVITRSFLGPITRVKVARDDGEITADIWSREAPVLELDIRVFARLDTASPRALPLDEQKAPTGDGEG